MIKTQSKIIFIPNFGSNFFNKIFVQPNGQMRLTSYLFSLNFIYSKCVQDSFPTWMYMWVFQLMIWLLYLFILLSVLIKSFLWSWYIILQIFILCLG